MNSNVTSESKKPAWIKWTVIGFSIFFLLMTGFIFLCMKQVEKAQRDEFNRVPLSGVGNYLSAAFDPSRQRTLLRAVNKLGKYRRTRHYKKEELAECETNMQEAVDDFTKVLGEDNEYTLMAYDALADVLLEERKYSEAKGAYEKELKIREIVYGKENRSTTATIDELADVELKLKNFEQARKLYTRSYDIFVKHLGKNSNDACLALENIGRCYAEEGKYAEAEGWYERALQSQLDTIKDTTSLRRLNEWLGWLKIKQKQLAEAKRFCDSSVKYSVELKDYEYAADSRFSLGCALSDAEKLDDALAEFVESEKLLAKVAKPDDVSLLPSVYEWMGDCLLRQGQYEKAEKVTQKALASIDEDDADGPALKARCLIQYANALDAQKKYALAEPAFKEAIGFYKKIRKTTELKPEVVNARLWQYFDYLKENHREKEVLQIKSELSI